MGRMGLFKCRGFESSFLPASSAWNRVILKMAYKQMRINKMLERIVFFPPNTCRHAYMLIDLKHLFYIASFAIVRSTKYDMDGTNWKYFVTRRFLPPWYSMIHVPRECRQYFHNISKMRSHDSNEQIFRVANVWSTSVRHIIFKILWLCMRLLIIIITLVYIIYTWTLLIYVYMNMIDTSGKKRRVAFNGNNNVCIVAQFQRTDQEWMAQNST